MKGLAPPYTLTGRVQRQLEDWTSASTVMARLGLPPKQYRTVQALLERLVKEGRAVKCEEDSTYRLVLPEGDDAIVGG